LGQGQAQGCTGRITNALCLTGSVWTHGPCSLAERG
jgi:hypothetical protein